MQLNATQNLIQKFGGYKELARAMNKPLTTVQYWWEKGIIPSRHQQDLLDKAKELGIALQPADFFDPPSKPTGKPKNGHRHG